MDKRDLIIWYGDPPLVVELLAKCAAPILWLAADDSKPTLLPGVSETYIRNQAKAPAIGRGTVYYQVQRLSGGRLTGSAAKRVIQPEGDGTIVLRYYLYFSNDAVHL